MPVFRPSRFAPMGHKRREEARRRSQSREKEADDPLQRETTELQRQNRLRAERLRAKQLDLNEAKLRAQMQPAPPAPNELPPAATSTLGLVEQSQGPGLGLKGDEYVRWLRRQQNMPPMTPFQPPPGAGVAGQLASRGAIMGQPSGRELAQMTAPALMGGLGRNEGVRQLRRLGNYLDSPQGQGMRQRAAQMLADAARRQLAEQQQGAMAPQDLAGRISGRQALEEQRRARTGLLPAREQRAVSKDQRQQEAHAVRMEGLKDKEDRYAGELVGRGGYLTQLQQEFIALTGTMRTFEEHLQGMQPKQVLPDGYTMAENPAYKTLRQRYDALLGRRRNLYRTFEQQRAKQAARGVRELPQLPTPPAGRQAPPGPTGARQTPTQGAIRPTAGFQTIVRGIRGKFPRAREQAAEWLTTHKGRLSKAEADAIAEELRKAGL